MWSLSEHDPQRPFPFYHIPFELRRKILFLVISSDQVIDLHPRNIEDAVGRLSVFLTSRRMHEEAYQVFYSGHIFRILPIHYRYFASETPALLARLPSRYRRVLITLELRLGPGWNDLPRTWRVSDRLGLEEMVAVRRLKVLIEIDPSHNVFRGFRHNKDFFTNFAGNTLVEIINRLPTLEEVELDGWPSVRREGNLMMRLVEEAKKGKKRIIWGPGINMSDPLIVLDPQENAI